MQKSLTPIIDVFLGNDETDLASFRIKYLSNSVSAFVIGESAQTFTGKPKPLYFQKWLEENPQFRARVSVVELDHRGNTPWEREIDSREQLARNAIKLFPGHGYIFSDLDEIPSRAQVECMRGVTGDYHFPTPTSYRKANWLTQDWNARWNRAVYTSRSDFNLPNAGRLHKLPTINCPELGAHLSYLGFNSIQMKRKLESSPHQEFDLKELSNKTFLDFCDFYQIDHLGRVSSEKFGLLRSIPKNKLTELQSELLCHFPQWFDFSPPRAVFWTRLRASALITLITTKNSIASVAYDFIHGRNIALGNRILLETLCMRIITLSFLKQISRNLLKQFGLR